MVCEHWAAIISIIAASGPETARHAFLLCNVSVRRYRAPVTIEPVTEALHGLYQHPRGPCFPRGCRPGIAGTIGRRDVIVFVSADEERIHPPAVVKLRPDEDPAVGRSGVVLPAHPHRPATCAPHRRRKALGDLGHPGSRLRTDHYVRSPTPNSAPRTMGPLSGHADELSGAPPPRRPAPRSASRSAWNSTTFSSANSRTRQCLAGS